MSVSEKVVILYFHPSVFRCVLLRWVRLLGFAIMYGTVVLKLYRYRRPKRITGAKRDISRVLWRNHPPPMPPHILIPSYLLISPPSLGCYGH